MDNVGSGLFCSKKMSILREIVQLSSYSVAFAEYACNSTVILGYLNKTMLTGCHACLTHRHCFVLFDVFLFCLMLFCSFCHRLVICHIFVFDIILFCLISLVLPSFFKRSGVSHFIIGSANFTHASLFPFLFFWF